MAKKINHKHMLIHEDSHTMLIALQKYMRNERIIKKADPLDKVLKVIISAYIVAKYKEAEKKLQFEKIDDVNGVVGVDIPDMNDSGYGDEEIPDDDKYYSTKGGGLFR